MYACEFEHKYLHFALLVVASSFELCCVVASSPNQRLWRNACHSKSVWQISLAITININFINGINSINNFNSINIINSILNDILILEISPMGADTV